MLQGRSLIILAVAILLGICAVIVANAYLGGVQQQQTQPDASKGMVKIAVAASPLDFGAPVTPEKVRFVDWPSWSVPEGAFRSVEQLFPAGKTHVVLRPMAAKPRRGGSTAGSISRSPRRRWSPRCRAARTAWAW